MSRWSLRERFIMASRPGMDKIRLSRSWGARWWFLMANSELLQKQVLWAASRRATAELEQMLALFIAEKLPQLDAVQCQKMLQLLSHSDWDI
ncbi:succinate dehydrogenase assembly factor 2, partial [Candidatus Magnetaquicoccus inordinatus]|uniref:succinate dehydrogenase assembly factor 2 n=1 Tax=Candidatus Magnetaquicoccus inordinatus TaxID=2496818 RepID=UPI003B96800B